ncbi:MAG: hypothetical protein A2140_04980 [Candidatus Muproteobacteria bacterium RBG_16_62_13]|uniref:Sel1 repeat family protein n=1 Tax=Candidatus Muproteobacteria bacterium RBG_16_62_13 TaxID=1817756 RepID=A0A1F6T1Z3_9PROT|nr:MAG: hypothetical protein A2140_04980 [Candidatus Muproteobacteria bacterium RBG_16_62_13]
MSGRAAMKLRFILAVFIVLVSTHVRAADVEDCVDKALVKKDPTRAAAACRRLADQGDARAQYNLGVMYAKGRGVTKDWAEAMKWYRRAADLGYAEAQHYLGFMYSLGLGVTQDSTEAAKWYRKAADQGHTTAQSNLGHMYKKGEGVQQDTVQAHMWYNLVATRALASETVLRDLAVKTRNLLAAKMTPAQIAEAQKLAREWTPK